MAHSASWARRCALVLAAALTGCSHSGGSGTAGCTDGGACPPGTVCGQDGTCIPSPGTEAGTGGTGLGGSAGDGLGGGLGGTPTTGGSAGVSATGGAGALGGNGGAAASGGASRADSGTVGGSGGIASGGSGNFSGSGGIASGGSGNFSGNGGVTSGGGTGGGSGGSGGSPATCSGPITNDCNALALPTAGCQTCATQKCCSSISTCLGDPICAGLVVCMATHCGSPGVNQEQCYNQFCSHCAAGLGKLASMNSCVATSCAAACQ